MYPINSKRTHTHTHCFSYRNSIARAPRHSKQQEQRQAMPHEIREAASAIEDRGLDHRFDSYLPLTLSKQHEALCTNTVCVYIWWIHNRILISIFRPKWSFKHGENADPLEFGVSFGASRLDLSLGIIGGWRWISAHWRHQKSSTYWPSNEWINLQSVYSY